MAATKDTLNTDYGIHSNFSFPGAPPGDGELHVGSVPCNYEGVKLSDGTVSLMNLDFSSLPDEFDENSQKENEILNMNRVKLTEYVHDCSVLHPYMKEKKIFNVADCETIQHEVTGAQRMDRFVDIVLTKGPKATGVFHEALKKPYPYVFDILTRLFTSAGVELSESRKIIDEPFEGSEDLSGSDFNESMRSGRGSGSSYSFRKGKTTILRHTIRKHIDELTERCEAVKNQRDELQKALLQREKDINALMNHRDRVIQQKYEDMLSLLANWREIVTHQSDGNIQKMQELLSEHEGIRQDYEMLEGDYMLVVSELSAARDRISKLLTHLQKMETEFALAQEEKDALSDKLLAQQGEIQRVYRRFERIGKDSSDGYIRQSSADRDTRQPQHHCDCKTLEDQLTEYEEKMQVCQKERRDALEERDKLQLKLHEEKLKRKKVKENLRKVNSNDQMRIFSEENISTNKNPPIVEETVFMPVDDSGMKIGLAVVVRELMDSGNALQNGVRIGDEVFQVNHIKLNSDSDPLQFAQRLLQSASQTVTLSIKRQTSMATHPQTISHTPFTPGGTLDYKSLSSITSPRPRPHHLIPYPSSNTSGSRSHEARDYSDDFSEEEVEGGNYVFSEPEHTLESIEDDCHQGFIASPQRKNNAQQTRKFMPMLSDPGGLKFTVQGESDHRSKGTLTGHVFGIPEHSDLTSDLTSDLDGYINRECHEYNSDSPDPRDESRGQLASQSSPMRRKRQHAVIRRKKGKSIRRSRRPDSENGPRLSRSVDDLIWNYSEDFHASKEDDSRMVLLTTGHLGVGLSILGGRGNGLYIKSDRNNSRSLKTGDRILQMSGRSALKMTYAEALELFNECSGKGKQCLLQVKYDREGYGKLKISSRDNFYVKAKKSHKSRSRQELSFEEGDIFHVIDTKPTGPIDMTNMWQVEKLDSRGHITGTGCIPINLENTDFSSGAMGCHSLPHFSHLCKNLNQKKVMNTGNFTLQSPSNFSKQVCAESAFKFYRPVNKIVVTEPRPVVLMGVFDTELSDYLVEKGSKGNLKFAFPSREPVEKMHNVEENRIIESISVPDGIMQSTVDDITELTQSGYHCVLRLTTSCLAKPKVRSLRPIVLTLSPHNKTIRVKTSAGRIPACFTKEVLGQEIISAVKDKIRHVQKVMMASNTTIGDIEVCSAVNVDELVTEIQGKVVEQQKSVFWEMDL